MIGLQSSLFAEWLKADGLSDLIDPSSHAGCALPTDQSIQDELNASVRGFDAPWYGEVGRWPEDDWIIGEMGNGDYYFVSRSGDYLGVWQYHHELRERELLFQTLREFYEFCIQLERDAGNFTA